MSDTGELAKFASPFLLPLAQRVKVKGIEFDEEFVAELISKYFINNMKSSGIGNHIIYNMGKNGEEIVNEIIFKLT